MSVMHAMASVICGYLLSHRASTPLAGAEFYCIVTEAHVCEQFIQGHNMKVERLVVTVDCKSNTLTLKPSPIL